VASNEVYGHDSKLYCWLEEQRQPYVLAVGSDQRLWQPDMRQYCVNEIASQLRRRMWKRLSTEENISTTGRFCPGRNRRAGSAHYWYGAVWKSVCFLFHLSSKREKRSEDIGGRGRATLGGGEHL